MALQLLLGSNCNCYRVGYVEALNQTLEFCGSILDLKVGYVFDVVLEQFHFLVCQTQKFEEKE